MCVTVLYGVAPASTITAHARMQAVLNGLFGLVVWVWAFGGRTTREQRPRRRLG